MPRQHGDERPGVSIARSGGVDHNHRSGGHGSNFAAPDKQKTTLASKSNEHPGPAGHLEQPPRGFIRADQSGDQASLALVARPPVAARGHRSEDSTRNGG